MASTQAILDAAVWNPGHSMERKAMPSQEENQRLLCWVIVVVMVVVLAASILHSLPTLEVATSTFSPTLCYTATG